VCMEKRLNSSPPKCSWHNGVRNNTT
jgi:hypothetical protein